MSILESTTDHHVEEGLESSDSDLGMLMNEGGEEGTAHRLSEMDELIVSADSKLSHSLAAFDDDSAGWVHAEGANNVDEILSVGSQTVIYGRGDRDGDDLSEDKPDAFTVLRWVNHDLSLLVGGRSRVLGHFIDTFEVFGVETIDQHWNQVGDT